MKTDFNKTFLDTARILRDKMASICATDGVGPFHVHGSTCRTNQDRLADLDAWIARLDRK